LSRMAASFLSLTLSHRECRMETCRMERVSMSSCVLILRSMSFSHAKDGEWFTCHCVIDGKNGWEEIFTGMIIYPIFFPILASKGGLVVDM